MQRIVRHIPCIKSSVPRLHLLLLQQSHVCRTESFSAISFRGLLCLHGRTSPCYFRSFTTSASDADDSGSVASGHQEVTDDDDFHFRDLADLDPRTLDAVERLGISRMTPIQTATFGPISAGKDVLGRAQTGTGKTFAFLIPTIQRLLQMQSQQSNDVPDKIQVVILSPTRELALQIDSQVDALLKSATSTQHPLSHQTMFGGIPKVQDISRLQQRLPSILVATPGRLADHIKTTSIGRQSFRKMIAKVDILILDEADRYIDMGNDIPLIISALPRKRQTLLFSATIPESVLNFLHTCMKPDFERIDCISADKSNQTSQIVNQSHVILKQNMVTGVVEIIRHYMERKNKGGDDAITDAAAQSRKILVFFPTTSMVSFYAKLFNFGLSSSGHYVLEIHSKKTQAYRTSVSDRFRTIRHGTLFSSDVSARGVDYPNITQVVQIGLPSSLESYVHRLGRTGRAGSTGEGILVLTETEAGFLKLLRDDGINIPVHKELQSLVNSEDESSKVRRELAPVLDSIRSNSNLSLVNAAEETYRSALGYYNGKLKEIGVHGLQPMVEFCNKLATEMGLTRIPAIGRKSAQKMGLDKVPGIVTDEPDGNIRPGRGFSSFRSRMNPSSNKVSDSGNYGNWGNAGPPFKSTTRRTTRSGGGGGTRKFSSS